MKQLIDLTGHSQLYDTVTILTSRGEFLIRNGMAEQAAPIYNAVDSLTTTMRDLEEFYDYADVVDLRGLEWMR